MEQARIVKYDITSSNDEREVVQAQLPSQAQYNKKPYYRRTFFNKNRYFYTRGNNNGNSYNSNRNIYDGNRIYDKNHRRQFYHHHDNVATMLQQTEMITTSSTIISITTTTTSSPITVVTGVTVTTTATTTFSSARALTPTAVTVVSTTTNINAEHPLETKGKQSIASILINENSDNSKSCNINNVKSNNDQLNTYFSDVSSTDLSFICDRETAERDLENSELNEENEENDDSNDVDQPTTTTPTVTNTATNTTTPPTTTGNGDGGVDQQYCNPNETKTARDENHEENEDASSVEPSCNNSNNVPKQNETSSSLGIRALYRHYEQNVSNNDDRYTNIRKTSSSKVLNTMHNDEDVILSSDDEDNDYRYV